MTKYEASYFKDTISGWRDWEKQRKLFSNTSLTSVHSTFLLFFYWLHIYEYYHHPILWRVERLNYQRIISRRDEKGSGHGLFNVLCWNYHRRSEVNYKIPRTVGLKAQNWTQLTPDYGTAVSSVNFSGTGSHSCRTDYWSSPYNVPRRSRGGVEIQLYSFFNLSARWRWVVNVTPRPLYPREREPAPILQEVAWAPGPVWTGADNLAPTWIRSLELAARSKSLYRLRHPGPHSD